MATRRQKSANASSRWSSGAEGEPAEPREYKEEIGEPGAPWGTGAATCTATAGGTEHIYFLQAEPGGLIKIGIASDVAVRLRHIQAMSPVPLRILAVVAGTAELETTIHRTFAEYRQHGEWFEPAEDILAFITEMAVSVADGSVAIDRATEKRQRQKVRVERLERELKGVKLQLERTLAIVEKRERDRLCRDCGEPAMQGEKYCQECAYCDTCFGVLHEGELGRCEDCMMEEMVDQGKCAMCWVAFVPEKYDLCEECERIEGGAA